jgi:cytochrome P450 family 20 subfamily A
MSLRFDPDRFNAESTRKRPSLAYVPFGIGQRRCPGYKFSKFEAISIVVSLLQNFSFKPAFDNDYFVEPSFGFVTKPETEIWINIKSRHAKA